MGFNGGSIVMEIPLLMDGLFHGKSIYKWMMTGVTRLMSTPDETKPWFIIFFGVLLQ